MIVLAHEPHEGSAPIVSDLRAHANTARLMGLSVHTLPVDLTDPESALGYLSFDKPTLAVLSTYIQRPKTYIPLYEAAQARNIHLIHTPAQNSLVMEFEQWYEHIADLTAKSVVVQDELSLKDAQENLEFPVFTKGQIKSVKEQGWDACVAKTPDDLALRASKWGEVIAREIMPLRMPEHDTGIFPQGREFRYYTLNGQIIGSEYYWKDADTFGDMTDEEKLEAEQLVLETASRFDCPMVTVDVGQMKDLSWRVIEIGDPQYSGICHMSRYQYWNRVMEWAKVWKP